MKNHRFQQKVQHLRYGSVALEVKGHDAPVGAEYEHETTKVCILVD